MKIIMLALLITITYGGWCQSSSNTFYIKSKGVYVSLKENETEVKVPFKGKEYFFFSIRNDTVAIIREIKGKRAIETKKFKISLAYDSVFVKRYSIAKGKRKLNVEKVIFRLVE